MKHKSTTAVIYTLLHFFVDFTTIFLISGVLIAPGAGVINRGYAIITYNLVAFAGQLPIGMIADVINKNRFVAAVGCLLAGLSYPAALISPWAACVCAAVGNGAFHIGAGSDILDMSMPRAGLSGLFVSSGALGVWLAYKAGGVAIVLLCPLVMLTAFVLLLVTDKAHRPTRNLSTISYKKPSLIVLAAVSCFMLTIVIRSLLGMVMNFSWKSAPVLSFLFVMAVVAGKALGGFLGDKFGYAKTAVLSLSVSLVAFIFSFDYPTAGIIAVLCFNMTMPLTLTAIAGVCNRKYGFAFGLTTFALAIGFIPVIVGAGSLFGMPLLAGGVLTSLVLLALGYALLNKMVKGGN